MQQNMRKIVLMLITVLMVIVSPIDTVFALSESVNCSYSGKINKKTIKIQTNENLTGYVITYANGDSESFGQYFTYGHVFPSKKCEDVFYSAKDQKIYAVSKVNNTYFLEHIKQYCSQHSDLEHYCAGNCKIKDVPCGNAKDKTGSTTNKCPAEIQPAIRFIKEVVMKVIQLFVPIILIIMGTIDFAKAVVASDDKAIKDSTGKFIKRAITAVLIFFVTTIVTIVLNALAKADISGFDAWQDCWYAEETTSTNKNNSSGSSSNSNKKNSQLYHCTIGSQEFCQTENDLDKSFIKSNCKPVKTCPITANIDKNKLYTCEIDNILICRTGAELVKTLDEQTLKRCQPVAVCPNK